MPRTALIVGAGIGGLAAALALRRAGWNVRVFEQAASPRELGFGVALAPNAIAALGELGVADTVLARAFAPRRGELRRPDGTRLKHVELPPDMPGSPMVVALRPALHGALLDAVTLDVVGVGSRAAAFLQTARGVSLELADGRIVDGDVLVGADGVRSVIRRALHPTEPPPKWSGIVAVRGVVHGALGHLGDRSGIFYLGRGIECTLVRASDTGIYWYLSVSHTLIGSLRDPKQIVALMAPRFDDTFRAVTSRTDDLRCDELVDRDPIPRWGRGLITLLGDAAHPLLPHTGQGAAQAIIDAVVLARALSGSGSVERALRTYEDDRRPKTAVLLRQGRRTARIMASTSPVFCWMRDAVIRAVPVQPLVRFYARSRRGARNVARR